MPVLAQEQVRTNHDEILKFSGDQKFLTGQHYYMNSMTVTADQKSTSVSSVYVSGNDFSFYSESSKNKVNTVVSTARGQDSVNMDVTHKMKQEDKVYTLKYRILFSQKDKSGVQVELDKEATDIKIDWLKITECVLKYAPEIYPLIVKCLQEPNVSTCILQLIQPMTNVYQCIFGKTELPEQLPRGISEVKKSWSLSKTTLAQYIELGNLNVIDKQIRITNYSSNITYLQVGADVIGNGVLKVYVVKATWMGTGSFSASGYVNLICQN